jgi:hypothetical protein
MRGFAGKWRTLWLTGAVYVDAIPRRKDLGSTLGLVVFLCGPSLRIVLTGVGMERTLVVAPACRAAWLLRRPFSWPHAAKVGVCS